MPLSADASPGRLQVAPGDVARMLVACAGLATPPPAQVLRGLASALRRQLDSFRPAELSQVRRSAFESTVAIVIPGQ